MQFVSTDDRNRNTLHSATRTIQPVGDKRKTLGPSPHAAFINEKLSMLKQSLKTKMTQDFSTEF
jgi:hypothetical protein